MNRSSRPRVASIRAAFTIAVVAGGAFALAGCSTVADIVSAATEGANSSAPETRSEDTGEIVAGGVTDVFQLRVGDCLNDPGSDEVLEVVTVPCADPHDYEVYHHAELEDGEYPTNLQETADDICMAAFTQFVGIPYAESTLGFTHYTPTLMSWLHDGDRAVDCLAYDEGLTSGSLMGSAR